MAAIAPAPFNPAPAVAENPDPNGERIAPEEAQSEWEGEWEAEWEGESLAEYEAAGMEMEYNYRYPW